MERWLGAALSSDAPGAGRSGTRRRAHRAERKKVARTDARIKVCPSQYPERLLRSPFSGSPGFWAFLVRRHRKHKSAPFVHVKIQAR
jgi:hypothetical protein